MEHYKIHVLVIDDIQDNLISLKALILEAFPDAEVLTATNASDGLEYAANSNPDVILLDIIMPGMDGFELCRKLKSDENLKNIPVIFITALKAEKEHRIKGLEVGAEGFLSKPIDESELVAQIRAMAKVKKANTAVMDEKKRLDELVEKQTSEIRKTHLATLNLLEDLRLENEARKRSENALYETEISLSEIFYTVNEGFIYTNLSGKILRSNKTCNKMLGIGDEILVGKHLLSLAKEWLSSENYTNIVQYVALLVQDIAQPPLRLSIKNRIVELNGFLNKNTNRCTYAITDITELALTAQQLSCRNDILTSLLRGDLLSDTLKVVALEMEKLNPKSICSILVADASGLYLTNMAAPHLPDFFIESINGISIGEGIGSCGHAAYSGKRTVVENIPTHPYWVEFKNLAEKAGLISCWAEPIFSASGKVLGTLAVYYRENTVPSELDFKSFQIGVDLARLAIEYRLTEEAAKESDETTKILFERSPKPILLLKNDQFIQCNNAALAFLGLSEMSQLVGHTPVYFSPKEQPNGRLSDELAAEYIAKAHQTGFGQFEWTHSKANGSLVVVEVTLVLISLKGEKLLHVTWYDLTERNKAELALKVSEERYRMIAENTADTITVYDLQLNMKYISPSVQKLLGYLPEELQSLGLNVILSPHTAKSINESFESEMQLEASGMGDPKRAITLVTELYHKNGNTIWAETIVSYIRDEHGNIANILTVTKDISERKNAQEQLEKSEQQFRDIFTFAPLGIYQSKLNGEFIIANQHLAQMLEYETVDQLLQLNLGKNIYFNEDERIDFINKYDASRDAKSVEVRWKKKNGSPIWVRLSSHSIKDIANNTLYFEGFVSDISDLKKTEENLKIRFELEKLIAEVSSHFISIHPETIDESINECLQNIGKLLQVDRSYIFMFSADQLLMSNTYEWCAEGVQPEIQNLQNIPVNSFPWWMEKLNNLECIHIPNVVEMPNEAVAEKAILSAQNIQSLIVLPLISAGKPIGYFGFDAVNQMRTWLYEDIVILKTLSVILTAAFERFKADTTLKLSEEKFRNLVEGINEVFFINDYKGTITYCSPNLFENTGYQSDEFIGQSYKMMVAPVDLIKVKKFYIQLLNSDQQDVIIEFRVQRKDGSVLWTEQNTRVVRDQTGKVIEFRNVCRNISKRKQAELELVQSREELISFFEDDVSADFVSTPEGKLLFCNKTFIKLFGFESQQEALDCYIPELYANQASRSFFIENIKREKKVENVENEFISKDGRQIYAIGNASGTFDEDGNLVNIKGYIVDITERKKAELELLKLSRAVEQSPVSVVISSPDGTIEYVNTKFCQITGYESHEAIGQNPRILKSGNQDEKFYKSLWDSILSGKNWDGELLNKKKNGDLFWEYMFISPLLDENGNITHFIAVKEDVTDKKKMLDDLIIAKDKAEEGDRLKSAFLTNMSHEIRTPLNGILGFAQVLSEGGNAENEVRKFARIIENSGNRLLQLINSIIAISKMESGTEQIVLSAVSPAQLISEAANQFIALAKNQQINLITRIPPQGDQLFIETDGFKVLQVLSNLISNALKFTKIGYIEVGFKIEANEIEFYVKDSGVGIESQHLTRVFERFYQADTSFSRGYEGAGLGLSLCKAMVELLGGEIGVESNTNESAGEVGSYFYFSLPLNIQSKISKTESLPIENQKLNRTFKNMKILIAEDDATSEIVLLKYLQPICREILTVDNGKKAVEKLREHPDTDLILMDIKMPIMDGYEATKAIRQFNSKVVILAQTAHAQIGDREKSMLAGCNDYISKPIHREKLLNLIEKFCKV